MSWQLVTRETEAACQAGANGKGKNILDTVGTEASLYASIEQSAAHTFSRVLSNCCSNGLSGTTPACTTSTPWLGMLRLKGMSWKYATS